jgi:2-keto-3-deoxy-L-rhamnonate aldolase RhmA
VETSSYGTQAVDAIIRVLGIDVVCHGSDLPYAAPARLALGDAALHAIRSVNPGRLLAHAT